MIALALGVALAADGPPGETTSGAALAPTVAAGEAAPASSRAASEILGADVALVEETRLGIEHIYQRRYRDAHARFDALTVRYPTSGVGPVGVALVYQAQMFENFDFRHEAAYHASAAAARAQLARGAKEPGNEALESFLGAGLAGVDAILALRKGELFTALDRAVDAMQLLQNTKRAAPRFVDTRLGDGMYLYWRTVVTRSSPLLPDFPDRRAEGIALMQEAERSGIFLGPGASLTLAYAYMEDRAHTRALDRLRVLHAAYPDNVINNLTRGRVYTSLRRYPEALGAFGEVLEDDPDNQRVHYLRGITLARAGSHADAAQAFQTYVGFAEPPAALRGAGWYRLGATWEHLGERGRALAAYEQGTRLGNAAARRALARLAEGR